MVEDGVKGAKLVEKLTEDPNKLLGAILIGNNIVNILASSLATTLFVSLVGPSGVGIATAVMTVLVLIFGEITPKSIAKQKSEEVSLKVSKPINIIVKVLKPFVGIFTFISGAFIRILGGDPKATEPFITEEELNYINGYIKNIDDENGTTTAKLTSAGTQLLNGTQAAAYCRIRYTEGSDYKRGERQRDILDALFNKFKTASIGDLISIMDDILPLVSTNLTNNEIISIVTTVLGMGMPHIEQASFPSVEKTKTIYTDMLHLTIDTDEITNDIHNFLYSSN